MTAEEKKEVEGLVRTIPDFPEKGIIFRDITTALKDKKGLSSVLSRTQSLLKKSVS